MRLLPVLAAALAAGLAVRMPAAAAALLVPVLVVPALRPLRVCALAFLAGALLPGPPAASELTRVLPKGAELVRVVGTVREGPDLPRSGRTSLTLDVAEVAGLPVGGRVRVLLPAGGPLPAPGARIAATGRLLRPRRAANPGERGPRVALAARGVSHLLALRAGPALRVLEPAPALSPAAFVYRLRIVLETLVAGIRPRRTAAFLDCLLLGRRDGLSERVVDDFRRAGTSHFLAISGLHVGLLVALLWWILRLFAVSRRLSSVVVAAAALLYALLTGGRPPALRAGLLVVLFATGVILRRPPRIANLLALAAIFILFADPLALDGAGFQLSFAAVLAILLLAPRFEEGLFARRKLLAKFSVPRAGFLPLRLLERAVIAAVPVSLAAWFGTAPIALLRFGTLSTLVVPANLLVFPFVALLLPAGLVAVLSGFVLPATLLVTGLTGLVHLLASIPGAAFTLPAPPLPLVLGFYALLVLAARRESLGPRWALGLVLALGLLGASGAVLRRVPAAPRVTALSVGHGLSVVVETPANGVLVYDAGSRRPRIFRRVLLPWLRSRGISRIDVLVMSHDDSDHVNGVPALLRALPVGRVVRPGDVRTGDSLPLPGARVEVLGPPPGVAAGGNDESTILRVQSGELTVLITGDLEESGVTRLLATGRDLHADVLVLPHHGRPQTTAAALDAAVGAPVEIASEGPGDPVDPCWRGAIRTSRAGTVVVRPGPRVTTFLPRGE